MPPKARIIVRFSVLKKPRIEISILDFLSPLKQTIIRSFLVSLVFINGISGFLCWKNYFFGVGGFYFWIWEFFSW